MHWVRHSQQNKTRWKQIPIVWKLSVPWKRNVKDNCKTVSYSEKHIRDEPRKGKKKKGRGKKENELEEGRKEGRKDTDISPCSSIAGLPISPLSPSLLFLFRLFLCSSFFSFFSTWSQSEHKDAPRRYQRQWGSSRGTDGRKEGVRARKRLEMHEEGNVTGRRGFRVWGKILDASTTLGTTTVAVWTRKPNSWTVVVSSFAT